ncbi:MAG: NHLP bacteriocin system secretion protein [Cyanobacteria bacterium P01_C01_bin.72]
MSQNNKIFRQEALDRLSSPEKLDQTLKVVNPRAWLPLATAGSLAVVALSWSVFGRIPLTVSGRGVLVQPHRVVPFQAPGEGQILELKVKSGDEIKQGDILGTIAQPALTRQLTQEQNKLAQLEQKSLNSSELQQQQMKVERENLQKQKTNLKQSLSRAEIERDLRNKSVATLGQNRQNLEANLVNYEGIVPTIRSKNLASLKQNRLSLNSRIQQVNQLLPTLEDRIDSYRQLLDEQLITGDVLLNTEREYFNSLAQLSELETQLKQLDVQETNTDGQYLQSLNQINDIKAKLKQLDVDEANIQRQYLQSLNEIDRINSEISSIDAQIAKLDREDLETSFERNSQIQEIKNRIAQLEGEIEKKGHIVSKYDGKVLELGVVPGQQISTGTRIGTIQAEKANEELVGVVYFADKDGKKIESGMNVQLTPSIVKRERYGGIVGEVTQVSAFPVTTQDMASIIGNQNLAEDLVRSLGGNAPMQVITKLEKNPDNASGFSWSSSKGPALEVSSGTTAQVKVQVGKVAPISYVIPIFRSLTGVY